MQKFDVRNSTSEERTDEIRMRMAENNISVKHLASHLKMSRQNVYQKFYGSMNYHNFFMFERAINEIIEQRSEDNGVDLKTVLDDGAIMPERAHASDAGLDIRLKDRLVLSPGERATVSTGIHVAIPEGYVGFMKPKSGLFSKRGIFVEGTIDAGYTGEICVMVENHSQTHQRFDAGDKICQLVIVPCLAAKPVEVKCLGNTERGENGFGSTGK